jgi:hypothetical protein
MLCCFAALVPGLGGVLFIQMSAAACIHRFLPDSLFLVCSGRCAVLDIYSGELLWTTHASIHTQNFNILTLSIR